MGQPQTALLDGRGTGDGVGGIEHDRAGAGFAGGQGAGQQPLPGSRLRKGLTGRREQRDRSETDAVVVGDRPSHVGAQPSVVVVGVGHPGRGAGLVGAFERDRHHRIPLGLECVAVVHHRLDVGPAGERGLRVGRSQGGEAAAALEGGDPAILQSPHVRRHAGRRIARPVDEVKRIGLVVRGVEVKEHRDRVRSRGGCRAHEPLDRATEGDDLRNGRGEGSGPLRLQVHARGGRAVVPQGDAVWVGHRDNIENGVG